MSKKDEKTNVMRILDGMGIAYGSFVYEADTTVATEIAELLGLDRATVFKTLVTVGKSGGHYVFMVPCAAELDLKKAATAAGEKAIAMIAQKELLPLTGYIHGGCSPIGMKKEFPTFIDSSALSCGKLTYSAGKIGRQVSTTLTELQSAIKVTPADITVQ